MNQEPYKSRGYIAVVGDTAMVESYREACESLTDTEMVAECATYKGYWFLQASEINTNGPVPMPYEEIKPELTTELNAMEKSIQYTNISQALIKELTASGDIEIDLDKFYEDLI